MDTIWIMLIEAVVVAAVGVGVGWLVTNGYFSKVQGWFESFVILFNNYGQMIKDYDEELYNEVKTAINTVQEAFEDKALTMPEWVSIYNSFKPLFKRVGDLITALIKKNQNKATPTE